MRRIQISIDDATDALLANEAARRGTSKAALIRASLARDYPTPVVAADAWDALVGLFEGASPAGDLDEITYGVGSVEPRA